MFKVGAFEIKKHEKKFFLEFLKNKDIEITYFDQKLTHQNKELIKGFNAICNSSNDVVDQKMLRYYHKHNIELVLTRSAGYDHIDLETAHQLKIPVMRVPGYSPYAVAEYALAGLMALNRKIHLAYMRGQKYDFTLDNLMGKNIFGQTVGVIGTGRIGKLFAQILHGMGAKVIAYDTFKDQKWALKYNVEYVELDYLFKMADIISLHTPLFPETKHIINSANISLMKPNVIIINSARGPLIDTQALLDALNSNKIGGVVLDTYEYEKDIFATNDLKLAKSDQLFAKLLKLNNVLITPHYAFFTEEAAGEIIKITLENIDDYLGLKTFKNCL